MVTAVEIENPYRYRAYVVGKEPRFDIQNDDYAHIKHGKVKSIEFKESQDDGQSMGIYLIEFEDGSTLGIRNWSKILVHYDSKK